MCSNNAGDTPMFTAVLVEEYSHILITITGALSRGHVRVLGDCCEEGLSAGKPVHLFWRNVPEIDGSGRRLLAYLAVRGVHIRANGIDNNHLIRAFKPEDSTEALRCRRAA